MTYHPAGYLNGFLSIHKIFPKHSWTFPDNFQYFYVIIYGPKRMMALLMMLRAFGIFILMFVRLKMFFKSGSKGSTSLSQISLSTIWTCQCVYAIPTIFVGIFLLHVRQKSWYSVVSLVRYIEVAVLVQLFYKFCFFTHISEIYFLLVLVSFLFILFSFFTVFIILVTYLVQNVWVTNDGRNNPYLKFFVLCK